MTAPMASPRLGATSVWLTAAIVVLALTAGVIHLTLGALMFKLNALGYFVLTSGLVLFEVWNNPWVVRFRWAPRVALIGYASASIVAWMIVGGFYTLGYVTKGIEALLIVLLVVDLYRRYGGFGGLVHEGVGSLSDLAAAVAARFG